MGIQDNFSISSSVDNFLTWVWSAMFCVNSEVKAELIEVNSEARILNSLGQFWAKSNICVVITLTWSFWDNSDIVPPNIWFILIRAPIPLFATHLMITASGDSPLSFVLPSCSYHWVRRFFVAVLWLLR